MTTDRTDEPSASAHETAREQYSANTEQVIAELKARVSQLEAEQTAERAIFRTKLKEAEDRAVQLLGERDSAISKARGAAG